MKKTYIVIIGVLAVMLWAAVVQASIVIGGFNQDEIFESPSGSIDKAVDSNNYAAWAQTGYVAANGTVVQGLPGSNFFISATGSGVTYQFQPYDTANALCMGDGNPASGTLAVVQGQYTRLYILATSGSGGGTSDITLNFLNGETSTYTNALYAPDWYLGAAGGGQVALGLRQRITIGNNSIDGDGYHSFQLYESVLNLRPEDQGKILKSVTFNNAAGGGATSVYDIAVVPLPSTVLLLGSGLLGLGLLRRKWSLKK
jgi:trimeric autotransporter adhesin